MPFVSLPIALFHPTSSTYTRKLWSCEVRTASYECFVDRFFINGPRYLSHYHITVSLICFLRHKFQMQLFNNPLLSNKRKFSLSSLVAWILLEHEFHRYEMWDLASLLACVNWNEMLSLLIIDHFLSFLYHNYLINCM